MTKAKHTPWNKGKGKGWLDKRGYRWIYVTENGRRRAKREHRHIMESHLGRELKPEELVHHINGVKSDNRIENLRIEEWGRHTTDHHLGASRPEYMKKTSQVLASYRWNEIRLKELNADLLEALEAAATALDWAKHHLKEAGVESAQVSETIPEVRAAIAKAKGGA